jgi:PAS domain S-box-containing protein
MSWDYVYTPLIWPMLATAIFSAWLGIYAWRHRTMPGAMAFAVQVSGVALWALFTAIEIAAISLPTKVVYHKLEAASAILSMSGLFYFALERSLGKLANRRTAWLLVSVTLFILVLMATNDLHHLLWNGFWFDGFVRVDRGPLNGLLLGWALLLPSISVFIFLLSAIRSSGVYRNQALMLFFGTSLPVLTFLLELFNINPIAPLDPVILAWMIVNILYAIAIFRFHMLQVMPIGRYTAFERMAIGILDLNTEGRIVDMNPEAGKILSLTRKKAIGYSARQALSDFPKLLPLLEATTETSAELVIEKGGSPRYYHVEVSPLTNPDRFILGQLIMLLDVTSQKRAQAQIIEQQRSLAMLHEREQLARELHDSTGQTLGYVNLKLGAIRKLIAAGSFQNADEQLSSLENIIGSAHADMREYILNLRSSPAEDGSFFTALQQYLDGYCQNYGIQVEIAIDPQIDDGLFTPEVRQQLFRIIQEACSNARRHAEVDQVNLSFEKRDGIVRISIQDQGRGFDPQQVARQHGGHFGLQFMHERAAELGGSLQVSSEPGQGTCVVVEVPLGQPSTVNDRPPLVTD